jgi:hypothetical protein
MANKRSSHNKKGIIGKMKKTARIVALVLAALFVISTVYAVIAIALR